MTRMLLMTDSNGKSVTSQRYSVEVPDVDSTGCVDDANDYESTGSLWRPNIEGSLSAISRNSLSFWEHSAFTGNKLNKVGILILWVAFNYLKITLLSTQSWNL